MSTHSINFIFDFLSPYSYLAWKKWQEMQKKEHFQNCDISYTPVTMAPIIKAHETKGPAEIESKRNFLFKDCLRYAALNNVEFRCPKKLPFSSLEALRMALCLEGKEQERLIDTLFCFSWSKGESLEDFQALSLYLKEHDFSFDELSEGASSREVRKKLKSNTKWAIEHKLFGVPSFWVNDKELFWGRDSLEHLELFIRGEDPMDSEKYQNFLQVVD